MSGLRTTAGPVNCSSPMQVHAQFTASAYRKLLSVYVFTYFPFGFEGGMLDLIVSVPEHCLSFYFPYQNYSGACKMFFDRCFLWTGMKLFFLAFSGHYQCMSRLRSTAGSVKCSSTPSTTNACPGSELQRDL